MASSGGEGKGRAASGYQYASYGGYDVAEERRWWPWLVPTVLVACVAVFVVEMFVNNCPRHGSPLGDACVAGFLRRSLSSRSARTPSSAPPPPLLRRWELLTGPKLFISTKGGASLAVSGSMLV